MKIMKNLNLNVQELSIEEQMNIDGGNPATILKWGKRLWDAIGIYDAISDFREGYNSVECDPC